MSSLTLLKNQGLNSTIYLLKTNKKSYVIKVFKSLHVDRKYEFKINQKAYQIGIGAKPIYQDKEFMISEFLDGIHKFKLKRNDVKNIALLLRNIHQIKVGKKLFNKQKDFVLCHHDLNPKNFLFSDSIKLIDWEYARKNDRYFDLATIIIEFKLNKRYENLLLNYYFKNHYEIDKKKILYFKKKYVHLCKKWFLKQKH